MLGLAGAHLLRPRARARGWLPAAQVCGGLALVLLISAFLRPALDIRLALAVWAPAVLAVVAATASGLARTERPASGLGTLWLEAVAASSAFVLVTAAWLVPLALVLGPAELPVGLFLGSVDPSGLVIGLEGPSLDRLHLYLPGLAAWAGMVVLVATRAKGVQTWYVLFGALALLGMYPRSDSAHALVSSPPILVAGAWALAQVRRRIVAVALLGVAFLAVWPQLAWRIELLLAEPYQPLGLPRAAVLVPKPTAEDTRGVVEYVQAHTPPDAPLFVYPAAPMLNFLSARPSPSRFDHFFPVHSRPPTSPPSSTSCRRRGRHTSSGITAA